MSWYLIIPFFFLILAFAIRMPVGLGMLAGVGVYCFDARNGRRWVVGLLGSVAWVLLAALPLARQQPIPGALILLAGAISLVWVRPWSAETSPRGRVRSLSLWGVALLIAAVAQGYAR